MTHLELENLASDYLEGMLDTATRAAVKAHLDGCADCRELLEGVRQVMELCQTAEEPEPSPWLVAKIMRATVGDRKLTWREKVSAFFRPALQPRVLYPIAMTVFTFSIMVNAAGINLRNLRLQDLNPHTWVFRANRQGHLMYARAEKFYYDLRVVYEIESRFRQISQPQGTEEETKPAEPGDGSSQDGAPEHTVAALRTVWVVATNRHQPAPQLAGQGNTNGAGRSMP